MKVENAMPSERNAADPDNGDDRPSRPRENAPVPPAKPRSVLYEYLDETLKSPYMRALLVKGQSARDGR